METCMFQKQLHMNQAEEWASEWNNPGYSIQPVTTLTCFFLLLFLPTLLLQLNQKASPNSWKTGENQISRRYYRNKIHF